ncbi:hypothetical protein DY000_02049410 [Brassica cretica]|uniref:Uncharacterized protein n=1 Tax=Brassica cretica TaxID=69181 RepID=A0ABQ7ER80_BRACR|nr:hypothetical protein DY000_02049410 [Brassica cretica]
MVELLLPNRELTCIEKPGIIHFNIVEAEFFGSHGPIDPVTAPRRKKGGVRGGVRAGTSAATQGESATPIYGPPRYHFTQRSTALPHGPLREAHEHIGNFGNLQRWNKAEGRTIFKLKTKVLGATMGLFSSLASIRTSFELAPTMVVGFVRLNSFDLGNERD